MPLCPTFIRNQHVVRAFVISAMLFFVAGTVSYTVAEPTLKTGTEDSFKRPSCAPAEMKNFMCYNPRMKAATELQQSAEVRKVFEATVARAQKYLDSIKPGPEKLVIFDLDDTLIDVTPYYAQPEPRDFSAWLKHRPVKYHQSVLKLLHSAKERGFSVVYITGRGAMNSLLTAEQVQDVVWDGAYTRPVGLKPTSQVHKAAVRKMLKGMGYSIVLNIGDQVTDHDLPIDESRGEFLLPNVMYTVY